jgi:hypothetical protein
MGLAYNVYLNAKKIYGCKNCKTHLADHDEIISRVSRELSRCLSSPPELIFSIAELPRPAWQSIPLQQRREHPSFGAERPQHDNRTAHRKRYCMPPVQRGGRVEVRQGIREHGEVQGGQVHPGAGAAVQRDLNRHTRLQDTRNCHSQRDMIYDMVKALFGRSLAFGWRFLVFGTFDG